MEINELVDGCKKGNRVAQKKLFEKFAPLFLAVSRRYSPASSDPMDNLHDSFIRIFEHIDTFDENRGNFEAWGRRIVINCALQKYKKKSNLNEMYPGQLYDEHKDDFDVFQKMTLEEIYKKIEQLPDGYRQVFCLYEIEGYSHKEIGDMLGIQEVSSRSNLSRSKKILQDLLSVEGRAFNLYKTN